MTRVCAGFLVPPAPPEGLGPASGVGRCECVAQVREAGPEEGRQGERGGGWGDAYLTALPALPSPLTPPGVSNLSSLSTRVPLRASPAGGKRRALHPQP